MLRRRYQTKAGFKDSKNVIAKTSLPTEIREYISNKIRVVTTNSSSVHRILVNNIETAKQKFFKCSNLCTPEKHLSVNLAEMPGVLGKVGKVCASFIPAENNNRRKGCTVKALMDLTNRLIAIKGDEWWDANYEGYIVRDENGDRVCRVGNKRMTILYNSNQCFIMTKGSFYSN